MNFIKNKILEFVIAVLVMIIIAMFSIATTNIHSRVAIVTEINDDIITTTCGNGNVFSFRSDAVDWHCGDLCSMIVFDNGTESVNDDVVLSVRYGGYVELFEEIENSMEN